MPLIKSPFFKLIPPLQLTIYLSLTPILYNKKDGIFHPPLIAPYFPQHCLNLRPDIAQANEEAEKAIEDYLKARTDKNPALFISNENEKRIAPGTIRRVFANACERSEFEGGVIHTLFATASLPQCWIVMLILFISVSF